jgi:hypothetical protein
MQRVRFENMSTHESRWGNNKTRGNSATSSSPRYFSKKVGLIIILILVILILNKIYARKRHRWYLEEERQLNEKLEMTKHEQKVRNLTIAAAATTDYSLPSDPTDRPLIMYSYSETPSSRRNALFFIQHGLHSQADFIFVVNGESDLDKILPNNLPNVRFIKKSNNCFDLGSMGEILQRDNYELVRKYKRFILMNSSIRGPFMPTWTDGCWSDIYLDEITDEVKLVGMSYNCHPSRHVQSMIFATDAKGIRILLAGNYTDETIKSDRDYASPANPNSLNGLSACPSDKFRAISSEISLTNLMYKNNYKAKVFMTAAAVPGYYDDCFHQIEPKEWENVTPYETLFVKANRNRRIKRELLDKLTKYHNDWGYSSWEACAKKK